MKDRPNDSFELWRADEERMMMATKTIKVYSEILKEVIEFFTDYTEEEVRWLMKATLGMSRDEKEEYLIRVHKTKKIFPGSLIHSVASDEPVPEIEFKPIEEAPPPEPPAQKSLWEF